MRCHIEWRLGTHLYDIWIFPEPHEGRSAVFDAEGNVHEFDTGTRPTPTLTMHKQMLDVFAQEASKLPLPDVAVSAHLADAVGVRDRLLSLVERLATTDATTYTVSARPFGGTD